MPQSFVGVGEGHCHNILLILAESGRGRSQGEIGCFLGKVVEIFGRKECHKRAWYLLENQTFDAEEEMDVDIAELWIWKSGKRAVLKTLL